MAVVVGLVCGSDVAVNHSHVPVHDPVVGLLFVFQFYFVHFSFFNLSQLLIDF